MCAMKTLYELAAVKYEFMSLNSTQFGPIFIRQLDGMSMNVEKKLRLFSLSWMNQ